MSERGRRRIAVLGMVLLTGIVFGPGAYAQQTHGDDDTSGQGGFVVIEDSSAPPPPAHTSPVTTVPAGGSGAAAQAAAPAPAPQYKPGTAAYEIPFVKQGAPTTPAAATAPAVTVATSKPVAPMGGAQSTPNVSPKVTASLISPPPPTSWDGDAPTDAKTMLLAWAGKAKPIWHVDWDFDHTFPIPDPVHYDGTFEQAVAKHFAIYTDRRRTKTPICLDIHTGNHTVHVYARDESNNCDIPESKQVN